MRSALNLALLALAKAPATAGEVGAAAWPERKRARIASHGGGDFAAQMLLGRARRAGLVRVAPGDGSSVWELTDKGRQTATALQALAPADVINCRCVVPDPGPRPEPPKRERPLTWTQRRMLIGVRDHGNYLHGVHGQSAHGGADGTWRSLVRRGLLEWRRYHEGRLEGERLEITTLGRLALTEPEAK